MRSTVLQVGPDRVLAVAPNVRHYGHLGLEILMTLAEAKRQDLTAYFVAPRDTVGRALFQLDAEGVRVLRPARMARRWMDLRFWWYETAPTIAAGPVQLRQALRREINRELGYYVKRANIPSELKGRLRAWTAKAPPVSTGGEGRGPYFRRRLIHAPLPVRLRDGMADQAAREAERCGIDLRRPLVTIHARESGYKRGRESQDKGNARNDSVRNASIERHFEAVDLLASRGYTVVRIGDASMRPVRYRGLVDLATSAARTDLVELACLLHSDFLICGESGPQAVSYLTNTPIVTVNATDPVSSYPVRAGSLVVFKKIVSRRTGRTLTLDDLVSEEHLANLRNLREFSYFENSAREVTLAVEEMLRWIDGDRTESPAQAEFRRRVSWAIEAVRPRMAYVRKWGTDDGFLGDGRLADFAARAGVTAPPVAAAGR